MENLIKRLLGSPFARKREVTYDDRGRMESVSVTLGLESAANPSLPERPAASADEDAFLKESASWLDAATLAHARAFALGEERTFEVDQSDGRLQLSFADGATLDLAMQLLGSFRPQDGSFRWAWANSSVTPALAAAVNTARSHPDVRQFRSFHDATFRASYEDSVHLAAAAARLGGCSGAYRCITGEHLSVFVGYAAPSVDRDAWFHGPQAGPQEETAALAHVDRYDEEMFPFDVRAKQDREANKLADRRALMDELIAGMTEVYNRHWRRDDDDWKPCSFGWPSDHDPAERLRRFALPRRQGGVYVITQSHKISRDAHVVEFQNAEPRITDLDLDWGKGLMLAKPERASN